MIRDPEKLTAQIIEWLRAELIRTRSRCFVVQTNMRFSLYSMATARLCQQVANTFNIDFDVSLVTDEFSLAADAVRYAEKHRGLIVGGLSREQVFARDYHKYSSGLIDILPIAELYHHEILDLSRSLSLSIQMQEPIIRELPASMIEWADRENISSNIVVAEASPNTSRVWFRYMLPQKEALSKLHQFEKLTRHKALVKPVFPARTSEFVQ